MALYFKAKVEYDDNIKRIPATEVKEEHGWVMVFNGDKKVGQFRADKLEHWALEEETTKSAGTF